MTSCPEFKIGTRTVGKNQPSYIIAEAGVNHLCRIDLALELVKQAKQAGADAIKFQTYKAETLVTKSAPRYWEDKEESGTQFAIFKQSDRFEPSDYRRLADYCKELDIAFLSTPFDLGAVELLDQMGMPAFKIASADLTNASLLEKIATTGKPILQSTGASTLDEISAWIKQAESFGITNMCLLHCVLCYPTDVKDVNLQRISLLAETYPDILIGYSDHTDATICNEVAVSAVTLGAKILEKHFTLDRSLPGDDHYHSADPDMLANMVAAVRTAETALGTKYEGVLECETQSRKFARRSIVAARDIACGESITSDMLIMKRPGTGIPPTELNSVVGRKASRAIPEDTTLSREDLE